MPFIGKEKRERESLYRLSLSLLGLRLFLRQIQRNIRRFAAEIGVSVGFGNFAQNTAGVAHRQAVVGNVFCNNASRADYAVCSDGDAGANNDICTNPAVIPNAHRTAEFPAGIARFGMHRVSGGVNAYARGQHHAAADGNGRNIKKNAVVIGIKIFAHMNVAAVVVATRKK